MVETPVLHVEKLTTRFRLGKQLVRVVDDVSFSLAQGQTLALVGESGCGKTVTALSLLRILPQIAEKPTGKVIYRGENLLELSERGLRQLRGGKIAMIFQDPSSALNPVYTVGDQLDEVAALHLGLTGEAAYVRALSALKEVGISSPE
ncbi:MAG: ABC transporter ATP-binding protein, partial [Chlamydiia bacterium]|nr:ABC transporter ATP-binding protein [Chlamydiia bacterium]